MLRKQIASSKLNAMQEHIVQCLKMQNSASIGVLYDIYGAALYNIVFQIVCCEELAKKVMQDTFLKVYRQSTDYDHSRTQLFAWILSIARSTALDAIAGNKTTSVEPHRPASHSYQVKIDEQCRVLIDLTYFKGYTENEASREMNIPVDRIKNQLRSAVSELRSFFKESIPA